MIAHLLQAVDYLGSGEDATQIDGGGLAQSDQLHALAIEAQFHRVHFTFLADDRFRQIHVAGSKGVHRVSNLRFHHLAHDQQPLQ